CTVFGTLGRSLVSSHGQRLSAELFEDNRQRHLHSGKQRRPPNHARSVSPRQSCLRNRLRIKQSPQLGRDPCPRYQAHFEVRVVSSEDLKRRSNRSLLRYSCFYYWQRRRIARRI